MTHHRTLALLALTACLPGCCDDCDDYDDCTTCDADVVYEIEINDTAPQANWIGVLYPGDALSIRGHLTQFGPDLFDGFAFVTGAPMQIDVSLWADVPGADLDLCVWDPVFGAFVTCFETAASPEGGSFVVLEAGKEIHLVARSFHGDSAYWLDVVVTTAVYGSEATPAPVAPRAVGAWELYAPARERAVEAEPGHAALLLDFAQDGSLIASEPVRVLPLGGR